MAAGFRDLIVWQRAIQLSIAIYRFTTAFPREEIYGLSSQLRRAGVSIPSNIAEGWGRQTDADYKHFLVIARGSNLEVQTQLVISRELGFGATESLTLCESLSQEVSRLLAGLIKSI